MACPSLERLLRSGGSGHAAGCAACKALLALAETQGATTACELVEPLLAACVAGSVSSDDEKLLLVHLDECPDCRQLAGELGAEGLSAGRGRPGRPEGARRGGAGALQARPGAWSGRHGSNRSCPRPASGTDRRSQGAHRSDARGALQARGAADRAPAAPSDCDGPRGRALAERRAVLRDEVRRRETAPRRHRREGHARTPGQLHAAGSSAIAASSRWLARRCSSSGWWPPSRSRASLPSATGLTSCAASRTPSDRSRIPSGRAPRGWWTTCLARSARGLSYPKG